MRIFVKNRKLLSALVLAILLLSIVTTTACRGSKSQRNAYKSQKEAVKENNNEHEEMLNSHYERI